VAGRRSGPYPDDLAAERALLEVVRRWKVRARDLGGWVWRRSKRELVVTVPSTVEVVGGDTLPSTVPRVG
jgi:hypothetical protein